MPTDAIILCYIKAVLKYLVSWYLEDLKLLKKLKQVVSVYTYQNTVWQGLLRPKQLWEQLQLAAPLAWAHLFHCPGV